MKNLIYLIALPLIFAACNSSKNTDNFTISGTLTDEANGKTVYLNNYDSGDKIDSIVVDSAKFVFTGHIDTSAIVRLSIDGQIVGMLVLEPGEITFNDGKATGTAGNDAFTNFTSKRQAIIKEARSISPDTIVFDSIQNVLNEKYESLISETYEANKDNAIGYYIFLNKAYGFTSKSELDSALTASPAFYKEGKRIKTLLESYAKIEETGPGMKFADFEIVYNDSTYRFSDYVGKGKYVLVDFWASWCGPCMQEIEVIKEIYNKYHDKGLEILGVAVWDEPEASLATIEAKQLPWTNIVNAQKIPTDIYGIMGIPHLILISPDGIIVNRGMQGDALREEVKKVMEP